MITLKQFLKPDGRKIVLTVILFIILMGPIIIIEATCATEGIETPPPHCNFLAPMGIIGQKLERFLFPIFENAFISFILIVILIYLLFCFIVWIYDKFRKKK